jgi:hypothetical protein
MFNVLLGEQQSAACFDIERAIVCVARMVTQPLTEPSAALMDKLRDIIERLDGFDHAATLSACICGASGRR